MENLELPALEVETESYDLHIIGARVHNLKNVEVKIPRDKLVVFTGLSGSGKSSLAFDTIYAEGQRRYIETFSAYARQFLGNLERPDVDSINGLSPVISIEQKTVNKNPRSTVGTITEVYDFLRLLFARASDAYSLATGGKMVSYNEKQIAELITEEYEGKIVYLLAPIVRSRKGHYRDLFEQISRMGFLRVRVNGEIREISSGMKLDRYKTHDIDIVIDRLKVQPEDKRLSESIDTALYHGNGTLLAIEGDSEPRYFSRNLMCPTTGISYPEPEPNTFSFNSPKGACPKCNGLGQVNEVDLSKVIPDPKKSLRKGGLAPLGEFKKNWIFQQIEIIGNKFGFDLDTPVGDIPEEALNIILYGANESIEVHNKVMGITRKVNINFEGVVNFIKSQSQEEKSRTLQRWADEFMNLVECPSCKGTRLREESLQFKILDKHIGELSRMSLDDLGEWLADLEANLSERQQIIAHEIIKEIRTRLQFLLDVGLGYLSLDRPSKTLSGGEAQRIRLATQIGSQLVGVLYILDEPSIGLHQRDNKKLIDSLLKLRDIGNSVLVVEHDRDMIEVADYVFDIGPGAGAHGGQIVGEGNAAQLKKQDSITAKYLRDEMQIAIPKQRRNGNGEKLILKGATGNNLKNISVEFPLGMLICVTGVSGSGKSTLVNETLYPILSAHFFNSLKKPLPYKKIEGLEHIDKVIDIDQSPIGRTPRSNPATYTGVLSLIRDLFAQLPEAKIRGYKPGRFSFNVKGGRCETCEGGGVKLIEMNFLPDVYVPCESCHGKRFNRETLEVRYKGKSISDILEMSVAEACVFFEHVPKILQKIKTLNEVGLGYITLGQSSTTLSGGEAQRVKLATELSKRDTGKTFYILDEPTTGLHFEDVRVLMEVLQKLVNRGNTVLVIEHNLDVIKIADYIIDIGPEAGNKGGTVTVTGTPEQVAKSAKGITSKYIKQELERV